MSRCHGHDPNDSGTVVYCGPDDWCNQVTTPVTQMVPGTVTNPAPHHTTPHHTTKNTSSRTDALGGGVQATARLRDIHPLDALAVTIAWIRPDWNIGAIRGVLARSNGSHHELAERALRVALDPGVRTPAAIENVGPIRRNDTPVTYPTVDEALNPPLCPDHGSALPCPLCRRNTP